ncbi:tryptophan synthase subunit alpha [Globicatella sanguinis]
MKLIAYLSNGFPNFDESFKRALRYVENGVDIIEADIPAANPYLDNDLLKSRIKVARKQTVDYGDYFKAIYRIQEASPNSEIIVNIYEDTIKEMGMNQFIEYMDKLKNKTVLLAGSNFPDVRQKLVEAGFSPSSFVTREMKKSDLELANESDGFVYLEGFGNSEKYHSDYPTLKDCVKEVRNIIGDERNIFVGIGVHSPEQFKEVHDTGADGVFLGSIVINKEDNIEEQSRLIRDLNKIAKDC